MSKTTLARSIFTCFSIALILGIAGCWGSKFTLVAPDKAKVDLAYVGDWDVVNTKGEHAQLIIRNIDNHLYYIETRDKDAKSDRYVGFLGDVKNAAFAHVRPLKDDGKIDEDWMLMRVSLDGNKLTLRQLDGEFFKTKTVESADQLRQVLEQNLDNPAMYAKDEELTGTRVAK